MMDFEASLGKKTLEHLRYISYVYLASTSVSVLGSLSVIIAAIWTKTVCRSEVVSVFHLSLADFFASCAMWASTMVFRIGTYEKIHHVGNYDQLNGSQFHKLIEDCRIVGGPVLCLYAITFLLTAVRAVNLYLSIRRPERDSPETMPLVHQEEAIRYKHTYKLYIAAWIVPVVIGSIMAIVYKSVRGLDKNDFMEKAWCIDGCLQLFNNGYQKCYNGSQETWFLTYKFIFQGTLLLVFLSNLIFYGLFVRTCRKSLERLGVMTDIQRQQLNQVRFRASLYQAIFVFCWTPSLVLAALSTVSIVKGKYEDSKAPSFFVGLYITQAALAPLQGFLNAIVYGWKRSAFARVVVNE